MACTVPTQLQLSHESGSCGVGRELSPPDPNATLSRAPSLSVTQHAGHDSAAVECELHWTASPSVQLDEAAGTLTACGERRFGVMTECDRPSRRAERRLTDLTGSWAPQNCDKTFILDNLLMRKAKRQY